MTQMRKPHGEETAENLQTLCTIYPSISEVCRLTGINRQQFGKYLKGTFRPSRYNMRLICELFGVTEADLKLPAIEFDVIFKSILMDAQQGAVAGWLGREIESRITMIDPSLRKYLGWYHSYSYSFGWPNMIIRSLVCFYEHQGRMLSKTVERIKDPVHGARFIYKSDGIITTGADRLFIAEQDSLQNDGFSLRVLFRTHRSHVDILSGLVTGTSSRADRQPSTSRVALDYLGQRADVKSELHKCGIYVPRRDNTNPRVLSLIDNELLEKETAFHAHTR